MFALGLWLGLWIGISLGFVWGGIWIAKYLTIGETVETRRRDLI